MDLATVSVVVLVTQGISIVDVSHSHSAKQADLSANPPARDASVLDAESIESIETLAGFNPAAHSVSSVTGVRNAGDGNAEQKDDWQVVQFDGDEVSFQEDSASCVRSAPPCPAPSAPALSIESRSLDMSEDDELAGMREQLEGKDELISALVEELEQVVEQLDRLQRSGERSHAVGGGTHHGGSGPSHDVAEEQQQVLDDLQRFVQQWDELQAASVLGRIESELAEMRVLMSGGVVQPRTLSLGHSKERTGASDGLDGVLARLAIDVSDQTHVASPSVGTGSNWERMKRQMLGEAETSVAEQEKTTSVSAPASERAITSTFEVADELPSERFTSLSEINLETATRGELQAACIERDASIVQLTRMLRSRCSVALPNNWDDIAGMPDEVKSRAEQLTGRLEEQVRLAEVELSLDRARLSRERSQLQADRATIERNLKRLNISSLDELENIAVESGSASDRRWMRFLGVNRRT